ncbi:MAG: hypothetical protein ACE5GE_02335 [Phycisphaerae bacterium]
MDASSIAGLTVSAGLLGLIHTLAGPDHYVPFIAMARARRWSLTATLWVTALCGVGHLLGSVVLAMLGLSLGVAAGHLQAAESTRGNVAGWLMLAFGLAYLAWGVKQAVRNRPHRHVHVHADGTVHSHLHDHHGDHTHVHTEAKPRSITPWVLFTIFVFGPCEPMIPLLVLPAARVDGVAAGLVCGTFAVATLLTMLSVVWVGYQGIGVIRLRPMERYGHVLAGLTLVACGAAMKLGL